MDVEAARMIGAGLAVFALAGLDLALGLSFHRLSPLFLEIHHPESKFFLLEF